MIPSQADDVCAGVTSKLENRVHAAFSVRTSIDVVAEKHDGITTNDVASKLAEDVGQRRKVAVDIADCNCGHVEWRMRFKC